MAEMIWVTVSWVATASSSKVESRARRAPPRGEQVFEQLVGEQLLAVVSQERLDASFWDQLAAQGRRIEQLSVGFASSLHVRSVGRRPPNSEHLRANCSAVS